jgi:hypothetical protein
VNATSYPWPYPIADFSSRGPSGCPVPAPQKVKPEVVAPGVDVYSSVPGGGYDGTWDGTSMAGPHVAGIVALIRQANPNLDVDSIKQILMDTARDEGTAGEDNTFGWGMVDAYAAVLAATVGFGDVQGTVVSTSWSDTPIAGARVRLLETGVTFTSQTDGSYAGSAATTYHGRGQRSWILHRNGHHRDRVDLLTIQDFALTDVAGPTIKQRQPAGNDSTGLLPMRFPRRLQISARWRRQAGVPREFRRLVGTPMTETRGLYEASILAFPAGSTIDYCIAAEDGIGLPSVDPPGAPGTFYTAKLTELVYTNDGEDPGDAGWSLGVAGDLATTGVWIVTTRRDRLSRHPMQPEDDNTPTPGVECFVTGTPPLVAPPETTMSMVGATLQGPVFDLSAAQMCTSPIGGGTGGRQLRR